VWVVSEHEGSDGGEKSDDDEDEDEEEVGGELPTAPMLTHDIIEGLLMVCCLSVTHL
jgi:hypothetical protein